MVEPLMKEEQSRGSQIVESLLAKPSSKPDFASLMRVGPPDILKRAQAFLPAFITSTDKILSCPEATRTNQMDVRITPADAFNPATQEQEFQQLQKQQSNTAEEGATGGQDIPNGSQVVNMVQTNIFNQIQTTLNFIGNKNADPYVASYLKKSTIRKYASSFFFYMLYIINRAFNIQQIGKHFKNLLFVDDIIFCSHKMFSYDQEIGVGLFDVENNQMNDGGDGQEGTMTDGAPANNARRVFDDQLPPGMGFHQTSTEPILKIIPHKTQQKCNHEQANGTTLDKDLVRSLYMKESGSDNDSESSSSGDEDRFMEFESSGSQGGDGEEDMVDAQSLTTMGSSSVQQKLKAQLHRIKQKRPLIQEISSSEVLQNADEESKSELDFTPQIGQKRRFLDR